MLVFEVIGLAILSILFPPEVPEFECLDPDYCIEVEVEE